MTQGDWTKAPASPLREAMEAAYDVVRLFDIDPNYKMSKQDFNDAIAAAVKTVIDNHELRPEIAPNHWELKRRAQRDAVVRIRSLGFGTHYGDIYGVQGIDYNFIEDTRLVQELYDDFEVQQKQIEDLRQQLKDLAQDVPYSHENFCNAWNNYPHDCSCIYREENKKLSRLKGDEAF